jgi:uncharacterized protein YutE (UPF0331/DUF86 family)
MSGDNPVYVRALVDWFSGREAWYQSIRKDPSLKKVMLKYADGLETRHLRDLVKRVRRLRSNIIHEYLELDDLRMMVSKEAEASLEDISKWGREKSSRK